MFEFGKRAAAWAATALLVVGGLAGCAPAEPKSAQEVVERYTKLSDYDNYQSHTVIDVTMSLLGQELPMSVTMDMDVAGDAAHGTMGTSLFGEDISSEVYLEKDEEGNFVQYTSSGEGDDVAWTKSTTDSGRLGATPDDFLTDDLLEGATFAAEEDGYVVSVSGSKFMEKLNTSDDMSSMFESLGDESIASSVEGSVATLSFDKDCRLTSISYAIDLSSADDDQAEGEEAEGEEADEDGLSFSLDVSVAMGINIELSNYGTVDATTLVVPDDVKANAVSTDEVLDGFEDLIAETEEVESEAEAA